MNSIAKGIVIAAALGILNPGCVAAQKEGAGGTPSSFVPPAGGAPSQSAAPAAASKASDEDAVQARYNEMLTKMRKAVEDIAGLYGNPLFVQLFTNDRLKAEEFRKRLQGTETSEVLQAQVKDLAKERDDLVKDIALRQKEADRITSQLVNQRAALDEVQRAISLAQKTVEKTSP